MKQLPVEQQFVILGLTFNELQAAYYFISS